MVRKFTKIPFSLCLCLIPIALSAQDVTSTFTGLSGSWNDSSQWSPAQVPDNTDTTTYEVLIDGGNVLDSILYLGGLNPTVSSLTIDSGDQLYVQTEGRLTIDGGPLTNNGILNLDSQSQDTSIIFQNGAEIEGSGVLQLSNSQGNRLVVTSEGETLVNGADHTIRGSGIFLDNLGGLTNEGQIIGNSSAGLSINPGTGTVLNTGSIISDNSDGMHLLEGDYTNEGSIIVRNSGKVFLNGSNINNTDGTITVEQGLLEVRTGTTTGGTISGTPGQSTMRIIQSGHTLNGVELNIDVMHLPDADITVNDSLTMNNAWNFQTASIGTSIVSATDTIFDGSGTISLIASSYHLLYGDNVTQTFGSDLTIKGAGNIGYNKGGIVINGTALADHAQALIIDPNGLGCTINGTVSATGAGGLTLSDGTHTNTNNPITVGAGSNLTLTSNAILTTSNNPIELEDDGKIVIRSSSLVASSIDETGTEAGLLDLYDGSNTLQVTSINTDVLQRSGADVSIDGNLEQNGDWTMQSSSLGLDLKFLSDATFSGEGTLSCNSGTYHLIYSDGGTLSIGEDRTIKGAGKIGYNRGGVVNNGTLLADHDQALTLDPNGMSFINNGLMSATGTGGLTIRDGVTSNTTNKIPVGPGSQLTLESGAILSSPNNPIELQDDGKVVVRSSTLVASAIDEAGTEAGLLDLYDGSNTLRVGSINTDVLQRSGADLTIEGDLEQNGDWTMQAASLGLDVKFLGDATFSGEGTLNCISGAYHLIFSDGGILTMGEDRTIKGAGKICYNKGGMINNGTIYAYAETPLTIDPNDLGFVNNGHLIVGGEGGMVFQSGIATNTSNPIELERRARMTLIGNVDLQGETQPINVADAGVIIMSDGRLAASIIDGQGSARINIETSNNILSVPIVNADINQSAQADVVVEGDLEHNGLWTMSPASLGMDAEFDPGAIFGGNGEMIMQSEVYHKVYSNNGLLVHDTDHTISGFGQVCGRKGGLENHGIIRAEGDSKTLKIEPNSPGSLNLGTWEVGPLATMHVYNESTKPFHNIFEGIELLDGTYSVEGNLRLDNANVKVLSANLILIGPEASVIDDGSQNITDEMYIITNQGILDLRDGHIMNTTVESGSFINQGELYISSGSELNINTPFNQRAGLTQLNEGILTPQSDFYNALGFLKGTGTVNASVSNNMSRIEPGFDITAGAITVDGDCSFDFFSTLAIDISDTTIGVRNDQTVKGPPNGYFDKLVVNGTANLDGYFEGWFPTGFSPIIGTRYPVLECTTRQQTFKFLTGSNIADGPYFILEYSPTGAELVITDIYITSQEVSNHLMGHFTLTGDKAALADDNNDGQIDSADVVSLINKGL